MERKRIMRFKNVEQMNSMMDILHELLVGNEDYINNNIVLNDSKTRQDGTENEIHIYCDFELGSDKNKELDILLAKAQILLRYKKD